MLAPENVFSSGRFHCPGCHATLKQASSTCPHCGFNADHCIARFPFKPPPLTRVMDPDETLDAQQQKRLSRTIGRLEKAFPQITVSFCVICLPEGVDGRQFGYWMLNRCPPVSGLDAKRRLHHLLLLVDRNNKTVSATVGYGLDCFLDDITLYKALQASREHFIHEGFVEGSIKWINDIRQQLPALHEKAVTDWKRRFNTQHRHAAKPDLAGNGQKQVHSLNPSTTSLPRHKAPVRQRNTAQFAVKTRS